MWKRGELKSFYEKQKEEEAVPSRDLGEKEVSIAKIIGSVGRYHDFDSQFRRKKGHVPERLKQIKAAISEGKCLPPVKLYKIKDEYYVLDGNHRVAAAKEFGKKTINAQIIEYLSTKETLENILYREKVDFESKTELDESIELTEIGQYAYLLKQIAEHQLFLEQTEGKTVSQKNAAEDWYNTIYQPLVGIIKRSGFANAFPERTLADLYAYISFYQWEKGRKKRRYGNQEDLIIPNNMKDFRAKMMKKKESKFPEMKRVVTAFLMIRVEPKREEQIMDKLFAYDYVKEVHLLPGNVGNFDIITKIVMERDLLSRDSEVIARFVLDHARRINGVIETQTIIPVISKKKEF